MRIIVNGACGRMGQTLLRLIAQQPERYTLAAAVDPRGDGETVLQGFDAAPQADIIIDFSHHSAVTELLAYAQAVNTPVIVATTGHTPEERALIEAAGKKIPVFYSGNMSLGPSGTALMLADAIRESRPAAQNHCGRSGMCPREEGEIGIHAIRRGEIVGIHEVQISTGTQTIILKHEAHDRALFADGALDAATFLQGKPAGLYNMDDLVR